MAKFFRKIRYDLIEKNKTGKYFKYAIGEIALVVIGILIALYINNWNENRIEKKEVTNYIKQIKTELKSDIIHYTFRSYKRSFTVNVKS
jgi:sensor domain CHASE-containing protein